MLMVMYRQLQRQGKAFSVWVLDSKSILNFLFGYYDNSFLNNYQKQAFIRDYCHAIGVELKLAQNSNSMTNEIFSWLIDLQRQRTSVAS